MEIHRVGPKQVRSMAGKQRRAALRLADRIESEMVTAIWLIGHFDLDLGLELLRAFRGVET